MLSGRALPFIMTLLLAPACLQAAAAQQEHAFRVAAVKYEGGGDWYQGQTPLPNLLAFARDHTRLDVAPAPDVVEISSDKLFDYPFVFMSGHGNIVLTNDEVQRLRAYLDGGGFLFIDDDYGLDPYIRRELQRVYPEQALVELPFDHPIYSAHYRFDKGPPKIHEHDNGAPRGFGILIDGRLAVYYTVESNISDGWESPEVHHDPPEKREAALRMGTNILVFAMTQ